MQSSPTTTFLRGAGLTSALRRLVVPVLILAVWQATAMTGVLPSRFIPPPSAILSRFFSLVTSGGFGYDVAISLARAFGGFAIGAAVGVALALVAGLSRAGEDFVDPTLQMLRTLPHLALVPLFILWFGIGELPKILLVALGAMCPIYINLFAGIRGVDKKIVEAVRTFGLNRREIITEVVLPGALPSLLVGVRYGLGISWLSLVVGEQINSHSGVGARIMNAREYMQVDVIMVCLIVYALFGLLSDIAVRRLEKSVLVWRPSFVER